MVYRCSASTRLRRLSRPSGPPFTSPDGARSCLPALGILHLDQIPELWVASRPDAQLLTGRQRLERAARALTARPAIIRYRSTVVGGAPSAALGGQELLDGRRQHHRGRSRAREPHPRLARVFEGTNEDTAGTRG